MVEWITAKAGKMITFLILAALAAVLACGGDRMTVREYAEECGDLGGYASGFNLDLEAFDFEDFDDFGDLSDELRDYFQEYKSLNPPDSLQDLHDARVEVMDFMDDEALPLLEDVFSILEDVASAAADRDEDELEKIQEELEEMEDEFEDLEDEGDRLVEAADEEFEDLSSRNREILRDSDCG